MDIPLRHPSDNAPTTEPLIRVVTPPGTSKRRRTATGTPSVAVAAVADEEDEDGGLTEEVFDTIMITVPFTFLFILLHMYVPTLSVLTPTFLEIVWFGTLDLG